MTWFRKLRIAFKLAFGFGVCLVLAASAGLVSMTKMTSMNASSSELGTHCLANTQNLASLIANVRQFRAFQTMALIHRKQSDIQSDVDGENQRGAAVDKDLERYTALSTDPADQANVRKFADLWRIYRTHDREINSAVLSGNAQMAYKAMAIDADQDWKNTRDLIPIMLDWNSKRGNSIVSETSGAYKSAMRTMTTLLIIALLVGIALAAMVTKQIHDSLEKAQDLIAQLKENGIPAIDKAVQGLAAGDLTVDIPAQVKNIEVEKGDEISDLCISMNEMLDNIRSMAGGIRTAQGNLNQMILQSKVVSDTIAASASEIASGNQDLAHRTSEQAASLEETAASVEQITSMADHSAEKAKIANRLADETKILAQSGGTVVKDAVQAMGGIEQASKKISEIISVIDDIAFQTNLLALNAAVEAARVGEQGKGFAVVATEVRSLAGRSATAAKEIKTLVIDTVQRVEQGTQLVNKSGEELQEIVASINKVAEAVTEISNSAQEQAAGIDQVNKAVMQMDKITQQNAALVEESSAASESMAQQASKLSDSVSRFKLTGIGNAAQEAPRLTLLHGGASVKKTPVKKQAAVGQSAEPFEEF